MLATLNWFELDRMNRNIMRPSANITVMVTKPPKPPCWRDFVTSAKFQSQSLNDSEFTDISKLARSSNESFSSDGIQISTKQGKPKRLRARIHRTRSHLTIEEGDLPEESLTVTLAETNPGDLGLCRQNVFDERIFQEDNNRKCQSWLQNIEASMPLEEVKISPEVAETEGEDVSIEVPDDTLWYDQTELRASNNNSVSNQGTGENSGTSHYRPPHRTRTYKASKEQASNSKGHRCHEGKHSVVYKGDKHVNTG